MDKETLDFVASKVDAMLSAGSASAATKAAAGTWKDAVANGQDPDEATNMLMDAITVRQTTVDDVLALAKSDMGKRLFGEEDAAAMAAHELARKKAGAKWCDCAACKPCHELLAKFGREEPDVYL